MILSDVLVDIERRISFSLEALVRGHVDMRSQHPVAVKFAADLLLDALCRAARCTSGYRRFE